ncbi:ParB/RepB/Spo0J family partition protein [Streptomyces sp. LRE541]|uniref:ParB/RepB/Spo0J family partition protein n=1 Tax=Streptomyces sp. LRE541 TaxID=2931983 RepID=UPI00200FECE9|nr:ParB/RepB/Spo0J family partition protein [Streptomyces sp. LRE541]UPZ26782.1 ParB/RepB/Spo0J family partition protein [Streptomyces sp. LRE541]
MNGQRLADASALVSHPSTELVPLSELTRFDSPRLSGADNEHVRLLAESDTELPPILVNRRTMSVVDGMHRVRAAELRGQEKIEAVFCECDDEEAFVLAVKANISHGLPLPRSDRNAAAERIVSSHPEWSDRAIASVTGLSHKTVGAIRRRASGEIPHSHTRLGRDGRERPVDAAEGREQAGRILAERPGVSLREVAREAGVCTATVRDVRDRLRRGEAPVGPTRRGPGTAPPNTPSDAAAEAAPAAAPQAAGALPRPKALARIDGGADHDVDLAGLIQNLRKDPSLRFSESGRTLLRLLDVCTVGPQEWTRISENVPPHRAEIIVSAARACSRAWQDFATELERRSDRQASG